MKKKDFAKELGKRFNSEEIALPESLSAENIERLINEKGGIVEPHRKRNYNTKTVLKWCAAAAASIVMIVGIGAAINTRDHEIPVEEQQQIIENYAAESDYSEIEKSVLNYFKDIYNNRLVVQYSADYDFGLGALLDNFGTKNEAAMDAVVGNDAAPGLSSPSSSPVDDGAAQEGTGNFATTNTQVEGVDEADLIKNDGKYIYYLRQNKTDVTITNCEDPGNMVVKSRIKLKEDDGKDMQPVEMFLYNDTLTVVVREYREYETQSYANGVVSDALTDSCCFALFSDTIIRMFDVSDKENPEEIYSQKMSGEYISSRITDGKLIVVTSYSIPYSSVNAENFDGACKVVKDICIPEYSVNGEAMQRIPAERIKMFDANEPSTYTVSSVIELDNDKKEPKMNAFLGAGDEIYCTKDEIFVAEMKHSYWSANEQMVVKDSNGAEFSTVTKIHRMNITDEGAEYISSVTVGGRCINQFSMDKQGDYFRIATNGMRYNGYQTVTMVYVIDKDMKIVGFLDNIAPGEDMKSARFMGDALYLVTFMQTDPLFVIDLSEPTKPEVKGELKIPGFSNYLHPIGNGLVIGIGAGGTLNGTDGTAKISLFDVSDPYNPKDLDNYSTSEQAQFVGDHKGFITIDENTFAACLTVGFFNGNVIVFSIVDGGIIVEEIYPSKSGGQGNIVRGTFIDTTMFVVNDIGIVSYDMTTKEQIERLSF